jgi:hypothetical protein
MRKVKISKILLGVIFILLIVAPLCFIDRHGKFALYYLPAAIILGTIILLKIFPINYKKGESDSSVQGHPHMDSKG